MITSLAWVLPRPNKNKYWGGFPLHFESRLLDLLRLKRGNMILQPFGGYAELGIRLDINQAVGPDIIADAHHLPFRDNTFDLVLLDPPYSDKLAKDMYDGKPPKFKQYSKEAVRVTKEGGFIVMYHFLAMPAIRGTRTVYRIFIETRKWHRLRCVHIHKKDSYFAMGIKGQAIMELKEC